MAHTHYLQQALALAQQWRGFCAPNPAVGVVVVKNGNVIATGTHLGAGHPHAEAEAFKQLSPESARDATVYVTLEPCCHQGRTPPCTALLIDLGVKAVYYGFTDPNPIVSGRGEQLLRAAGIECQQITLPEINDFYQSYLYWMTTKRPWVTAKLAMSLDGKIAGPHGQRIAITGPEAQIFTHQWRKRSDAILTTAKTIICDDPQLNVRLPEAHYKKPVYVIDAHLSLPRTAQLLQTAAQLTVFHQPQASPQNREWLVSQGVHCVPILSNHGKIDLGSVLDCIGHDGMHDVLLEAGGICFSAFMTEKHIQRAFIYVALKWLGNNAQSAFANNADLFRQAHAIQWHALGDDAVCEFKIA